MAWVIMVFVWSCAIWFNSRTFNERQEMRLVDIPLRLPGSLLLAATAITLAAIGIFVAAVGVGSFSDLPEVEELRDQALPLGFAVMGSAEIVRLLFVNRNLRATENGLSFFTAVIPSHRIEEFRVRRTSLLVGTPRLRRSWNGWKGTTSVPLLFWRATPAQLTELVELVNSRRGLAPER
jgi:hypothetical protein